MSPNGYRYALQPARREGPRRKLGRPRSCQRTVSYALKFGLAYCQARPRTMTSQFLDQLDLCKSDEARRLLLGVSEKFA